MPDLRACDNKSPHTYHGWTEDQGSRTKYHVCNGINERCEATVITTGRVEKVHRCDLPLSPHSFHLAYYDNGKQITWTDPKTSSIR